MKTLNWISLIGLLINVGLNYQLIPLMGIKGAAIATLFTQVVVVGLQLGYIGYQFKTYPAWQLLLSLVLFSSGLYFLGSQLLEFDLDHKISFVILSFSGLIWALITRVVSVSAIYRILKFGD